MKHSKKKITKVTIKVFSVLMVIALFIFLSACLNNQQAGSSTVAAGQATSNSQTSSSETQSSITGATTNSASATTGVPPNTGSTVPPQPVTKIDVLQSDYVVFAWNDLGMHCANPTYDTAVILPPYNTVWAQVVKRGNPPQVVTQGITVDYQIINNTYSYGKGAYGQFWDNSQKLFGASVEKDKGLNLKDPNVHNGLSGAMAIYSDHFEAVGIPLTPIDDLNNWNAYQVAQITVKDSSGNVIAQTETMAPVSDEINCAKCHGADAFNDILQKHDKKSGTDLVNSKPVLCASCHGDPALGAPKSKDVKYLSDSIHGFHSTVSKPPSCYDCHPGQNTKCSRSIAHTTADGNCITCHGELSQVSGSIDSGSRVPWANEPKCITCHSGIDQVDTGDTLYRNAMGHGNIYCASCHSSPHAMVPTTEQADNYQALEYQGKAVTISSCAACHPSSKGEGGDPGEFPHTGPNPENPNACYICHTSVNSTDTTKWPHSFQWKSRQN
jgi:hypothetical protein